MPQEPITREEALRAIADGHAVYSVAFANRVLEHFGAEPIEGVPMYSDRSASNPKGLRMQEEGARSVSALTLGDHLVGHFGLADEVQFKNGRGFRGQENLRVIRNHLEAEGI